MEFFTPPRCKLSACKPTIISLIKKRPPTFQDLVQKQFLKHLSVTVTMLLIVFMQISYAAGPITGKVTNEKGEALAGVTVQVKGKSGGSTTDSEGKYTLNVTDSKATLVFSYIGYTVQEVAISGRTTVDIKIGRRIKSTGRCGGGWIWKTEESESGRSSSNS